MSSIASEADIEKLVIDVCVANGWKYRPAAGIGRPERSVFLEGQLREALKRLNPCIAENPDYADVVVYRLRLLANTVLPHDLVTQNERFRKLVFEENSFPFGKDGRAVSVKFFDYDNVANNDFVVTNQWTYPQSAGGKRLDVVLCVNGIPLVVGEIKTPFRPCISWMDGVKDISDYEKSIPQMFVTNAFNFACDGRSFRYGAVGASATVWGPWFAGIAHEEGTFEAVKKSMSSMLRPEVVLDVFRYFTVFSTDKRNRTIKVVARYQQYEGANMIIARTVENKIKKGPADGHHRQRPDRPDEPDVLDVYDGRRPEPRVGRLLRRAGPPPEGRHAHDHPHDDLQVPGCHGAAQRARQHRRAR